VNNGKTIYYNITSSTTPLTVEVTYNVQGSSANYSGNVDILTSVAHSRNAYTVTSIGEDAFPILSSYNRMRIFTTRLRKVKKKLEGGRYKYLNYLIIKY
jgi:ribonuclease PH